MPDRCAAPVSPAHRAGLLLVGVLLLGANLRAGITAVGPLLWDIERQAGLSGFQASLLVSLPLVAFAVVSPFAPRLAEKFGLERVLGLALGVLALGIVVRSVPGAGLIWVGTLLLGAAIAVMNVLIPALIKRDWPHRIGPMTGVYQSVTAISAALASGVVVPIAQVAPSGWRLALGVWAGIAIIGLAVFLPWILGPRQPVAAAPGATPGNTPLAPRRTRLPLRSALAWQVTAFMGLQSTLYYVMVTWLPAVQVANGATPVQAGWYHFGFQACGLVGTLVAASVIPRTRSQSVLGVAFTAAALVGVLGLLLLPELSWLWALFTGLCTGGAIVVAMALFGLRTTDYHQAAGLSSMAQSGGYVLAATGPVVIGALRDTTGEWTVPLLVVLAAVIAQGVFVALAGRNRTLPR